MTDRDPRTSRDPAAQRAFRHAHRVLERELAGLVSPARLDAILQPAVADVAEAPGADPARRLRDLVGARLLDAVGDLLGRVDAELPAARPAGSTLPPSPGRPGGELPGPQWNRRPAAHGTR